MRPPSRASHLPTACPARPRRGPVGAPATTPRRRHRPPARWPPPAKPGTTRPKDIARQSRTKNRRSGRVRAARPDRQTDHLVAVGANDDVKKIPIRMMLAARLSCPLPKADVRPYGFATGPFGPCALSNMLVSTRRITSHNSHKLPRGITVAPTGVTSWVFLPIPSKRGNEIRCG